MPYTLLSQPMPRRRQGGFTLIELMITVAVVAILASIALPAYQDYVVRGKLPEAFNQLSGSAITMEQFFQDNRSYASAGACGVAAPAATTNFSYSCAATTVNGVAGAGYLLTATGASGTTTGFVFTLDQSGARATTGVPSGWTSNNACWITSKSGTCA